MKEKTENELKFALVTPSGVAINDVVDWDKITNSKWVKWGFDNKMPNILWDNYLKCGLLSAIINQIVEYIYGEGVEGIDNDLKEVLRKCIFDYILFGGFTIECIRNAKGDIVSYNYQNVMNVRVDKDLTTAYISNKWNSFSTTNYIELPLYDKTKKDPHFIFYYRGDLTRGINPIPSYISALKSIEILNNTRNFHKRNLENGFTASVIVNLNDSTIKSRELKEIKEKLEEGYTGSENAGRFLLLNGGDKDHAATILRLNADNFGDLYRSLDESSKEDLYTAFRINPILLGKNVNTGFSKEEFENAFKLFYTTSIKPLQNRIKECLSLINLNIDWKEFEINWA